MGKSCLSHVFAITEIIFLNSLFMEKILKSCIHFLHFPSYHLNGVTFLQRDGVGHFNLLLQSQIQVNFSQLGSRRQTGKRECFILEGWDLGIFLRVRESTLQVTAFPANPEHTC